MEARGARMRWARPLRVLLAACLVSASLVACAPTPRGEGVVVLFPGDERDAWGASAEVIRAELARNGSPVELRFAGDDIPTQLRQLQEALAAEPAAIVVAPVDVTALAAELLGHERTDTAIIAYERLVLDAPEIDVFASFNHREVGRLQARALLDGLGITDAATSARARHAVELLAGSGDDPHARDTHAGALEVLQPYLDTGAIVVPSGRLSFADAAILRAAPEPAAERIAELLTEGVELAGVIAPTDAMSAAVTDAVLRHGWTIAPPSDAVREEEPEPTAEPESTPDPTPGPPEPPPAPEVVLVGAGSSAAGLEAVHDRTRTATVYRDPHRLARAVANMVREVLRGSAPTVTRGVLSDNGAADISTRLVAPLLVTTIDKAGALLP